VFDGPLEISYRGKLVRAELASHGVSASGSARPSNAGWVIIMDGSIRRSFERSAEDTRESVAVEVHAWIKLHPDLFDAETYREYVIEPTPRELSDGTGWSVEGQISKPDHRETRVRLFKSKDKRPTRAEAVALAMQLGRDLLDGKVPGHSVKF
jgi:hypothetical protein